MMDKEAIINSIKEALVNLDGGRAKELVKIALDSGMDAKEILNSVVEGMEVIGRKFEASEYYLPELVVAGDICKEIFEIVKPTRKKEAKLGKVVIGTVKGDLHDIGKNIVAMMLESAGFEVIDLGADVSKERFVEVVEKERPNILAMSTLLTSTMMEMKEVVDGLKERGLRNSVKIIVGGAPITEDFAREIGADGYGEDAVKGVKICRQWMKG